MANQSQTSPSNSASTGGQANTTVSTELSQQIGVYARSALDKLFENYVQGRNDMRGFRAEQQHVIEAFVRATLSSNEISEAQRVKFSLLEKIEGMKKKVSP